MVRPVRSKASGLFNINSLVEDFNDFEATLLRNRKKAKKPKVRKSIESETKVVLNYKKPKMSKSKSDFLDKLEDKLFNQFNKKDWLMYWQYKAEQYGVRYIIMKGNYVKEYAILGSLMNNFQVDEIKLMIDFLWDCNHDIHNKKTMGTWILSKGWINSVYQSALLWRDGEYKTQAEQKDMTQKRNREWVSSNEGDKPKKKNKIRI